MRVPFAAILAAAAVDAAGGVLAGVLLTAGARGRMAGGAVLFLCVCIGAVMTHAALLPGLIWASGPVALGRLAMRLGVAVVGMVLAAVASFAVALAVLAAPGGLLLDEQGLLPALAPSVVLPGAAGLVAALAQRMDLRPGTLRAQTSMHVAGGVLGSCLLVGSAWASWELSLVSLAAAGLPHTLLCVRAAAHAGHVWPSNAVLWRRTAWCCGTLVAAAGMFRALSL